MDEVDPTKMTPSSTVQMSGSRNFSIYKPNDCTIIYNFKGSSLLNLHGDDALMENNCRYCGENDCTGCKGDFPDESILPTTTKRASHIVSELEFVQLLGLSDTHQYQHTLEEFARDHFRPPPRQHTLSLVMKCYKYTRVEENLWSHRKKPIRQPLLKELVNYPEQARNACDAFKAVLKYMGDFPTKRSFRHGSDLLNKIFESPLKNELLKDEIYCQIIKQLTENKFELSEERGWELMWLVTGIFACNQTLMPEVTMFLRSSSNNLATDCLHRLQKTIRHGQRKYPPHPVEVKTAQLKTKQIFYKVFFPDNTNKTFDVDSGTRAKDFCQSIAQRLRLKSSEGFSLFVKTADKVISIPEGDFFFDRLCHLEHGIRKERPGRKSSMLFQVFCMKKLWTNMVPGWDPNADIIFHYHQEMSNLLQGYHKVSKEEAAQLAALQYRVHFGDNKSKFQNMPQMMKELLPANMIRSMSPEDWKRVVTEHNKHSGMSQDEAKIAVLKLMYRWPTFGSAFFEVKQTSEPTMPEDLRIAINKLGVNLIDPRSKDILATYPFTKISNWSSGNTYFHMTIGNGLRSTKLLCSTSTGYKMDDLLNSYSQMSTNMNKQRANNRK